MEAPVETTRVKPLDTSKEEFYDQSDSAYVRVKYIKEEDGFKFEIRNELYHNTTSYDDLTEGAKALGTLVRGMTEMAIQYPSDVYRIGLQAQNKDFLDITGESMPKEHANLLKGDPKGSA